MQRYLFILPAIFVVTIVLGCQSKVLQMIFEPQELYNYAVTDGVTCTDSQMIDGNVQTKGYAAGQWIHLTLPTQKTIHRIAFRGTNITRAVIYEKLEGEGRWHVIHQIEYNDSPVIEMRVSGVVTEAIRIYITGTTDEERKAGTYDPSLGAFVSRRTLGRAFIHELEVYGLVSKEKAGVIP